jgi:hypothetical protein
VPQKYAGVDPRDYKLNEQGRCLGNVIRIPAYRPPNIKQQNYHVAAYPEELVALMLSTYTDEGDLVLDPFLGSGTTSESCSRHESTRNRFRGEYTLRRTNPRAYLRALEGSRLERLGHPARIDDGSWHAKAPKSALSDRSPCPTAAD